MLSWFGSSILSVTGRFPFLLIARRIFICQIPFLYPDCILSLHVLGFPILFRFWQKVWCRPCTFSVWSCDLLIFYPPAHFLRIWETGITIPNSNGDSASPWNIPPWIFISAKPFPLVIKTTLQVSMVFWINSMTTSGILHILRQCTIQLWGTIS